ncbi:MAG: hypothetical protein ACRD0N_12405 [Acidimicrobiales bacterium]
MDEVERRRFLDTLRSDADFRATVRRELLTDELLNLPQTVTTLIDVVTQQRQDFTALATAVHTYMERTISLIGDGFAATRARFDQVDARIGQVEARFDQVEAEFSQLRAEVSELRTATQAGFAAVDARFDQVDADFREIKGRLAS